MSVDLLGNKYNRLMVISFSHRDKKSNSYWVCVCDCGTKKIIRMNELKSGMTQSCGCLRTELSRKANTIHGMEGTPTYISWMGMKARCNNPNHISYKNYGGRGISVCKRWEKFENFYADMGMKPKGLSLDRVDNDGNYVYSNCRWATWVEQNNNRRDNI